MMLFKFCDSIFCVCCGYEIIVRHFLFKLPSIKQDILKQIKPTLTPHYFRHNYVTMLYEAGVDPLIAMKIVGHTDYQTTANIYTHVRDEMLKKATVNMNEVFQKRTED